MAKYESKALKNVAVVGHGGTGKTSLCESLLYVAGKTDRPGRVDDGTSSLDYEPEEQKRHVSISAALSFLEWDKQKTSQLAGAHPQQSRHPSSGLQSSQCFE